MPLFLIILFIYIYFFNYTSVHALILGYPLAFILTILTYLFIFSFYIFVLYLPLLLCSCILFSIVGLSFIYLRSRFFFKLRKKKLYVQFYSYEYFFSKKPDLLFFDKKVNLYEFLFNFIQTFFYNFKVFIYNVYFFTYNICFNPYLNFFDFIKNNFYKIFYKKELSDEKSREVQVFSEEFFPYHDFTVSRIKKFSLFMFSLLFIISFLIYICVNIFKTTDDFFCVFTLFKFSFIYNLDLIFGLDRISLLFIVLTTFTFFIAYLTIFFIKSEKFFINSESLFGFTLCLFILEFFLILVFSTLNFFFFFFFFECLLIPLYLFINLWGHRTRKFHASYQLFLFTMLGSIFLTIAIFILYSNFKTLDIRILSLEKIDIYTQTLLFILIFFGLAVKIPTLPFHIWLPEAHVEAQTAGSIILAAILLKVGSYGMFRFLLPLTSDAIISFSPFITCLCLLSILISSLAAFRQVDFKKIIAYSSISHMNFVVLGLMSLDLDGILGSLNYMIAHAFISMALFFCVGILYDRSNTRDLTNYGGLYVIFPVFSFFFFLFNLANTGFPLFFSFISELLILIGLIKFNFFIAFFLLFPLFLVVIYSFWLIHSILFGEKKINYIMHLNKQELFVLIILLILIIFFNFFSHYAILGLDTNVIFFLKLFIKEI